MITTMFAAVKFWFWKKSYAAQTLAARFMCPSSVSRRIRIASARYRVDFDVQKLRESILHAHEIQRDLGAQLQRAEADYAFAKSDLADIVRQRVAQKQSDAALRGLAFKYNKADVQSWLVDPRDVHKLLQCRDAYLTCKRLKHRLGAVYQAVRVLARKQESLETLVADCDVGRDLDHVTRALEQASAADVDRLTDDILTHVYASAERLRAADAEENATLLVDGAFEDAGAAATGAYEEFDFINEVLLEQQQQQQEQHHRHTPIHIETKRTALTSV
jgi:hypothetical protein